MSHNKIGRVYEKQGKLAEALAEYQADKRIMEGLTALDPANTNWQRNLAASHTNVGSVYQAEGKLDEALDEYQEAKRIMEGLTTPTPPTPIGSGIWRRRTPTSGAYQAQGKLAEALAEYQEAKRMMEGSPRSTPPTPIGSGDCRCHTTTSAESTRRRGNWRRRWPSFKRISGLWSASARLTSPNTDWQRDLAVSHNNVGSVHRAQGKLAAALDEYQASKRIMQGLERARPLQHRVAAGAFGIAQQHRERLPGAGEAGGGDG